MSVSVQGEQSPPLNAIPAYGQSASSPGSGSAVLLPTPSGDAQTDAMSWMYLFTSKQQALDMSNAHDEINRAQQQRAEAYKQELQAIQQSIEAASHHGFWHKFADIALTVGKVAAVVGSIAVAVGTCGAGAVGVIAVVGAVLSTASFVEGEAHVLQKLGVDEETATWVDIGMSIAGAACTGGAALTTSSAEVAEVVTTVSKVSAASSGAAGIIGGVAKIEARHYEAAQQDALADAAQAQAVQARLQRLIAMMLDEVESSRDSDDKALAAIRGALSSKGDTLVSTSTMRA